MKTNNRSVIKKSLLSIFSAAAIMAGSVIPVFADTSDTANSGIFSFQKQYTYSYPSSVNSEYFSYPKEKFTFTSSQGESKAALGKISNTTLNSKKGVIEDAPSDNTTIPQYINIGSADYSTDVKKLARMLMVNLQLMILEFRFLFLVMQHILHLESIIIRLKKRTIIPLELIMITKVLKHTGLQC